MLDLRKTAEAFFAFLEENEVSDFSELPPEQMQLWMYLKNGQRFNMHIKDMHPPPDNVIPLRRRKEKVLG